jgi:hypothetical protein
MGNIILRKNKFLKKWKIDCLAALPGSIARQPIPAALPCSFSRQHCKQHC